MREQAPKYTLLTCRRCGWQWFRRENAQSGCCPHCHSRLWNQERKPYIPTGVGSEVIKLRLENPCLLLQQLGDKVGVTRERVRQILKKNNLPTKHFVQQKLYECLNCGKPTKHPKYCIAKCRWEYTHPLVECEYCHKLFRRGASYLVVPRKHLFCSRRCNGKYVGEHYGFTAHPENGVRSGAKRKYDYALVQKQIAELRSQGYSLPRISEHLNIPLGSLYAIRYGTKIGVSSVKNN